MEMELIQSYFVPGDGDTFRILQPSRLTTALCAIRAQSVIVAGNNEKFQSSLAD